MSLSCPSWCSCAASGLHKGGSRLWSNRQMYPLEPCSKLWHPKSLSDNDSCCSHYILLVWASATTKKTEGSWVNWWMYARLQQQLNTYPNFTMFPVRTGRCDSPCLFCVYCLVHLQKPRALSLGPLCTEFGQGTCTETRESSIFFGVSAKSNNSNEFKSSRDSMTFLQANTSCPFVCIHSLYSVRIDLIFDEFQGRDAWHPRSHQGWRRWHKIRCWSVKLQQIAALLARTARVKLFAWNMHISYYNILHVLLVSRSHL